MTRRHLSHKLINVNFMSWVWSHQCHWFLRLIHWLFQPILSDIWRIQSLRHQLVTQKWTWVARLISDCTRFFKMSFRLYYLSDRLTNFLLSSPIRLIRRLLWNKSRVKWYWGLDRWGLEYFIVSIPWSKVVSHFGDKVEGLPIFNVFFGQGCCMIRRIVTLIWPIRLLLMVIKTCFKLVKGLEWSETL